MLQLLRSLLEPTRVETGCVGCRLYGEVDDPNWITWIEEWSSGDDLERHLRSPQFRRVLGALDLADAEPEIRFDTVVKTDGLQIIAKARGVQAFDENH